MGILLGSLIILLVPLLVVIWPVLIIGALDITYYVIITLIINRKKLKKYQIFSYLFWLPSAIYFGGIYLNYIEKTPKAGGLDQLPAMVILGITSFLYIYFRWKSK
ncbi:MAG: hypothetical protein COA46_07290 [Porticoccaceae bacterium]|nr:MAG: hypothetical protein COA46_07290 [Porticoccaceae bacterium]